MAAPVPGVTCTLCRSPVKALGLCRKHYLVEWYKRPATIERELKRRKSPRFLACKLAWSRNNKDKIRQQHITTNYGLSGSDVQQMVSHQLGVCAICESTLIIGGKSGMHVDHDHSTGKVRGLLCMSCNRGLGGFRDNPESLRAAIRYLEG